MLLQLRENIMYVAERFLNRLGDQDKIDEQIEAVMTQANIKHHFQNKDKFPQGLDTPCYKFVFPSINTQALLTVTVKTACLVERLDQSDFAGHCLLHPLYYCWMNQLKGWTLKTSKW